MRISQLLHAMDKDDVVEICDFDAPIDDNLIYKGSVRGISRDNPINRMHVECILAQNGTIFVLARKPRAKGGETDA